MLGNGWDSSFEQEAGNADYQQEFFTNESILSGCSYFIDAIDNDTCNECKSETL
jgi:hypothetical protein